nr:hypothetical protein [Mycolicibacterium neoaurum]
MSSRCSNAGMMHTRHRTMRVSPAFLPRTSRYTACSNPNRWRDVQRRWNISAGRCPGSPISGCRCCPRRRPAMPESLSLKWFSLEPSPGNSPGGAYCTGAVGRLSKYPGSSCSTPRATWSLR